MKVIITGASRGIGRGIAAVLARYGHQVGLLSRTPEQLREVKREIESDGGFAATAVGDLRSYDSTTKAIGSLIDELKGVDALVNNAGLIIRKPAAEIDLDDWHAMIETNVHGPFYACRAVLRRMLEQQAGHIVNISSISGYFPLPGGSGYAASKYAMTGFSESLMQEVRDHGIKVTTIFPGSVDTASHRHDENADHSWKVLPEEVGEAVEAALNTRAGNLVSRIEIRPLNRPPK